MQVLRAVQLKQRRRRPDSLHSMDQPARKESTEMPSRSRVGQIARSSERLSRMVRQSRESRRQIGVSQGLKEPSRQMMRLDLLLKEPGKSRGSQLKLMNISNSYCRRKLRHRLCILQHLSMEPIILLMSFSNRGNL